MYTKLEIKGTLEVVTGLHIGGSSRFSAIGTVDSPVIRDSMTDLPMIPGSSMKGKIRSLLARELNDSPLTPHANDNKKILRLFGSNEKASIKFSRLIFSDSVLSNFDELKENGIKVPTEVKFENVINRLTAIANPRQIERVIPGAKFPVSIIYNIDGESLKDVKEDMENLATGLKLLTYDYLGGNGSRGYGKVKFENLTVEVVTGHLDSALLAECKKIIEEI